MKFELFHFVNVMPITNEVGLTNWFWNQVVPLYNLMSVFCNHFRLRIHK